MAEPARLPPDAPESVRAFVECRSNRLELDLRQLGWLSAAGYQPSVELLPGSTAATAPLRVTWDTAGFLTTDVRLTVVSGRLSVDTGILPSLLRSDADRWIADFNRTLTERSKELDQLRAEHDRVTFTKRDTPPHGANAGGLGGFAAPGSRSRSRSSSDTPAAAPSASSSTTKKLIATVTAIALVLLGGLGVWASRRSSGERASPAVPTPTPAPQDDAAAVEPTEQPPPAEDPATDDAVLPTPTPDIIVCGAPQVGGERFAPGSWDTIDALQPCQQLPSDGTFSCDSTVLPCPGAAPWLVRARGIVGISHDGSVPDAVTGEQGPSQAEYPVQVLAPAGIDITGANVRITSDCGEPLTGRSALEPNGTTLVAHPLFSFGPCRTVGGVIELADGAEIELPASMFGTDGEFVVDSAAVAAALDVGNASVFDDSRFRFESDWSDGALTTLGVLAATPLDGRCVRLAEPTDAAETADVLATCRSQGAGWVLAAGFTHDASIAQQLTPVAHGAGFVNPEGRADSAAAGFDGFDTSGPLFDQTIFPCGVGHVGVTVCPSDSDGPVAAGSLIAVTVVFDDALPVEAPDRTVTIDFAPSGGPAWSIGGDGPEWTIDAGDATTDARAVIRNDSLTLLVPHRELPDGALQYVLHTTDGEATLDQPLAPVLGTITTPTVLSAASPSDTLPESPPTSTPAADIETIAEFYEQFAESIRNGDTGFLLERLHPVVHEAYPGACPAILESFSDPDFDVTLESIGTTDTWEWVLPDGRTLVVADATTVTIVLTGRGQSATPSESHLALVDGVYRWFTFCV